MELRTKRMRMRPMEAGDLDTIHRLLIDPGVRRYLCDDIVFEREQVGEILEKTLSEWAASGMGLLLATPIDSTECIGLTGLRQFGEEGHWELMYAFYPQHWGKGLAVEASVAVLDFAFQELHKVAARTDPPNLPSIRVMDKLGMRFTGETVEDGRPTINYWITKEEWDEQANRFERAAGGLS
jgi:[ribosomal protein S5]-alanine N-acetyltransferase